MFSPEERALLRSALLEFAARDGRISAIAITGSGAAGREDRWSDIDLAFGIADPGELPAALSDWTDHMYQRRQAVHHLDVRSGAWIYRVFLLPGTLQVDLAFVPAAEFRALAPSFRLVCGHANEARHAQPAPADLIGLGWLYALHARTSIARGKLWQALYMIGGVRDHALALASLRHGLPTAHARGVDQLPPELTAPWEDSLIRQLETPELSRAFQAAISGLMREIRSSDVELARRLEATFKELDAAGA